mgnify:CR=1 FL=1
MSELNKTVIPITWVTLTSVSFVTVFVVLLTYSIKITDNTTGTVKIHIYEGDIKNSFEKDSGVNSGVSAMCMRETQ